MFINTLNYIIDIQNSEPLSHLKLLYTKIYSPKYIESQYLKNKKKINYDKVEDIKFGYETW